MSYYIDTLTKKLHREPCFCIKEYANDKELKEHWIKFGSLKLAEEYCKKSHRKYHYCGKCFKEKKKVIVK